MPGVARIDDTTYTPCNCHSQHLDPEGIHVDCGISGFSGRIISGSNIETANGKGIARRNDSVQEVCSCCGGGNGTISSGSSTMNIDGGRPVAKVGDSVNSHAGFIGRITSGSDSVFCD